MIILFYRIKIGFTTPIGDIFCWLKKNHKIRFRGAPFLHIASATKIQLGALIHIMISYAKSTKIYTQNLKNA